MSLLEIKNAISRLTARERREIQIYLHQLKRATPSWRKATAKKIADVRAGEFTTLAEMEAKE